MKYRTVVELICDASDKEEAINIAGEYLKGEIDFGVDLRCTAVSLWAHRMKKYTASCAILLLMFSTLFLKVQSLSDGTKIPVFTSGDCHNTYTVQPALKTTTEEEFKKEWEEKKGEAVLDYLKD